MKYSRIKSGSIQFWGEWFGGRPYEDYHEVIETNWFKSDVFIVKLDQGEVITIYRPINVIVSEQEFSIKDASLIVFDWFSYGRAHTPENLCHLEYKSVDNSQVLFTGADGVNKVLNKRGLYAMQIK